MKSIDANSDSVTAQLGFPAFVDVAGHNSVAELFGRLKSRCGLYLLRFADGILYIGRAVDAVRRFAQHRARHGDIVGFTFRRECRSTLDVTEQAVIHMAEAAGFPITNRVHVSHVLGDTDLDFVVSRAEQDAWLAGKVSETPSDLCANIPTAYSQRLRFAQKFARLRLRPDYPELVGLLSRYVRTGILFPRRTGYSFWRLTCLPSTNAHTWPRLACVNVNMMEVFVVGHHLRAPEAVWGFVIVAESAFRACYPSDRVFARAWPGAWVEPSTYRAAGADQLRISTDGLDNIAALLRDLAVRSGVRLLTLRLMRKGATRFARFHCHDLADAVLGTSG